MSKKNKPLKAGAIDPAHRRARSPNFSEENPRPACEIPGCPHPQLSRGLCRNHYARDYRKRVKNEGRGVTGPHVTPIRSHDVDRRRLPATRLELSYYTALSHLAKLQGLSMYALIAKVLEDHVDKARATFLPPKP